VVKAAAGKQHTVVVTEDGSSFAFGSNKNGQLGTGSLKSGEHPAVHVESLLQLFLLAAIRLVKVGVCIPEQDERLRLAVEQ
jgi:alpha-tubulin suppressor-like RCC1 family protein